MGKKRKFSTQNSNNNNRKTPAKKFAGKCYKCGKPNHKADECKSKVDIRAKGKEKDKNQANLVDSTGGITKKLQGLDLCAVTSEVNMVGDNTRE